MAAVVVENEQDLNLSLGKAAARVGGEDSHREIGIEIEAGLGLGKASAKFNTVNNLERASCSLIFVKLYNSFIFT